MKKTVVLGVTGGIAAYKAAGIASALTKLGISVFTVMTENACEFVTPLTFRSLTNNPVYTDMFGEPKSFDIEHISLAERADLILVAPATANFLGKVAGGIADCLLSTVVMASKRPVVFAPAMNTNMYENPVVRENISKLKGFGYRFIGPDSGRMACGSSGAGRLSEPEVITEKIVAMLHEPKDMQGLKVMITAGPTQEPIDPVRYITNHSSGKMGLALHRAAVMRGADALLVSLFEHEHGVKVTTAAQMYDAVIPQYRDMDIIICAAAVSDYRPLEFADRKIKSSDLTLKLTKNPDILGTLGKSVGKNQKLIGFALETDELEKNALAKLERKNADMIVANSAVQDGAGFMSDTNKVTVYTKTGDIFDIPMMDKLTLAHRLYDIILGL